MAVPFEGEGVERSFQSIKLAGLSLAVGLSICVAIVHTPSVGVYGISEYAVRIRTLWALALSFVATAYFTHRSSQELKKMAGPHFVTTSLDIIAACAILIIVTPFTIDTFFNWTHMTVGAILFLTQLALSLWMIRAFGLNVRTLLFLAIELGGGIIAMFSLPDNMLPYMFQGEVIFQVGFFAIMITNFRKLSTLIEKDPSQQTDKSTHGKLWRR